jgi:hypothetical protein
MTDKKEPHGTWSEYVQGCRCDKCKIGMRNYFRDYRRKKKAALVSSAKAAILGDQDMTTGGK